RDGFDEWAGLGTGVLRPGATCRWPRHDGRWRTGPARAGTRPRRRPPGFASGLARRCAWSASSVIVSGARLALIIANAATAAAALNGSPRAVAASTNPWAWT